MRAAAALPIEGHVLRLADLYSTSSASCMLTAFSFFFVVRGCSLLLCSFNWRLVETLRLTDIFRVGVGEFDGDVFESRKMLAEVSANERIA
jgi:hypothetical protein